MFFCYSLRMRPNPLNNQGANNKMHGVNSPLPSPEDGWVSSGQLRLGHQRLFESEVDDYLTFQFSGIAYRPPVLTLRKAASVVRYLRQLAAQGVPHEIEKRAPDAIAEWGRSKRTQQEIDSRNRIDQIALAIWHSTIQFAAIKPASVRSTRKFLRDYSTYLPEQYKAVADGLEGMVLPTGAVNPFQPPRLVSRRMSVQGASKPRQMDDLSERLAVTDHALKSIQTKKRHLKIAESLNALKVFRTGTEEWDPDEIKDRVNKYKRKNGQPEIEGQMNASIHEFRFNRFFDRKTELKKAILSRGLLDQMNRVYGWSLVGSARWDDDRFQTILLKPDYTLAGFIAALEVGTQLGDKGI